MARNDAKDTLVEQAKSRARRPVEEKEKPSKAVERDRLVPSGCTLQNLACTDTIFGAFLMGTMINIIGDSGSGKTEKALEILAACAQEERFDDWDFLFDDVEASQEFDIAGQFGRRLADRMQSPYKNKQGSDTVEEFRATVGRCIRASQEKDGRPFIYILDSFDALTTDEELERNETIMKGKEAGGTYGTGKAKSASEMFRVLTRKLKESRGLLVIISQVRENMERMPFSPKYKRAGGKALDFYAIHKLWLAHSGTIKAGPKDRERITGHSVVVKGTKNKYNGKERTIEYNVLAGYGIDDIGANVEFMINEKYWQKQSVEEGEGKKKKSAQLFVVDALGVRAGSQAEIVKQIEAQPPAVERRLRGIVGDAWREIEAAIRPDRRPRFR